MKAIVLTFDDYHPFTLNMLKSYESLWPDHPFEFRVPYNTTIPQKIAKDHREETDFVRTDSSIRATVLTLLEDLDDDEWVYWSIDDKYPMRLDTRGVARLAEWVENGVPDCIDGICFHRARGLLGGEALGADVIEESPVKLIARSGFHHIWLHQFLKVKVLRHLFTGMPQRLSSAKEMDSVKFEIGLPDRFSLYVSSRNQAVFGESTTRGAVTSNCRAALDENGIVLPPDFPTTDNEIVIGSMNHLRNRVYGYLREKNPL